MKRVLLFCVLSVLIAGPALAHDNLIYARDPYAILEIARSFHSAASMGIDSRGDPKITSAGAPGGFSIFFYGCDNGANCQEIQFSATWSARNHVTLSKINDWNRRKIYTAAYINTNDKIILNMAVNMRNGISPENLRENFRIWERYFKAFRDEVIAQ